MTVALPEVRSPARRNDEPEIDGAPKAQPPGLEADRPPEARGLARDGVRLMVSRGDGEPVEHARFRDLPALLAPGDLLVVNTSATLPAAVPAQRADGVAVELHFSTAAPQIAGGEWWTVELRSAEEAAPMRGEDMAGERLALPGGARVELVAPYRGDRLWLASFRASDPLPEYLSLHGRPVRYRHQAGRWPLAAYQTVFALEPGSAEMPSAARPFSAELVVRLAAAGIAIAPLTLHAGLSSPERDESPFPERYSVPVATAARINAARETGARVIAVGTTVARALETVVAGPGWKVAAGAGWSEHVIRPERGVRAIDGLITGWHDPASSHLDLLAAVGGRSLTERAHREAIAEGYLWHEFGDSHLILPSSGTAYHSTRRGPADESRRRPASEEARKEH